MSKEGGYTLTSNTGIYFFGSGEYRRNMDFLKVAKDDANLVSLSSSFHDFAPRYENAFWPVLVLSKGICKFVSVERRMR